jgi:hypothetical protein
VYLAWRGRSVRLPFLRPFSFWGRAAAARRVARASATEVIYRLLAAGKRNPRTKTLVVGHSLGGMIVEQALTQALVSSLVTGEREMEFPADLVILLNSAAEATTAKQFIEMLERERVKLYRTDSTGEIFERPLMVSVTSEVDSATRLFLPAGRFLNGLPKRFRSYGDESCAPVRRQKKLFTHTAGNLPSLHSHVVTQRPLRGEGAETDGTRALTDLYGAPRWEVDPVTQRRMLVFQGVDSLFTIREKVRSLNDTPYWIMSVPREIIAGHGEIFGPDAVRLIGAMLSVSGALEPSSVTLLTREAGFRPIAMCSAGGRLLLLERSRRIYGMNPEDSKPAFLACLPAMFRPEDRIGLSNLDDTIAAVFSSPVRGAGEPRFRTETVLFSAGSHGIEVESVRRIRSDMAFVAAAVDIAGQRVFLTAEGEPVIYAVPANRREAPRPLLEIDEAISLDLLHYDGSARRIYAADASAGMLFLVDPQRAEAKLLAGGLGSPAAIVPDVSRSRMYVADALGKQVWALACDAGFKSCEANGFVDSSHLESPQSLAVTPDGTLWIGDIDGQRILAFSGDGRLLKSVGRQDYPESP